MSTEAYLKVKVKKKSIFNMSKKIRLGGASETS